MLDRDAVEKALLLGIVRDKNWQVLILNNINKDYFTYANHRLYQYIEDHVNASKYPELAILAYEFEIDDQAMREYLEIVDLNALCEALKKDYIKGKVKKEINGLNDYSDMLDSDPVKYIDMLGNIYTDLKGLGYHNKSIGLFDNIEEILKIDHSDVIITGFKE